MGRRPNVSWIDKNQVGHIISEEFSVVIAEPTNIFSYRGEGKWKNKTIRFQKKKIEKIEHYK